jgi:opacity protein-like surface antigen
MYKVQRKLFYFLLLLFHTASVHAAGEVTSNIVEISPGIGYYNFDEDRDVDDTAMATIGLGLQFSRHWLALLHYSVMSVDSERSRVDMEKYHLDAHYFFNTESAFRPYLVAGFGQLDLDEGLGSVDRNMFNAGAGLSYRITPSWFVRTDARIFSSTNGDFDDNALTLTLGYRFSGGEKAD